MTRLIVTGMSKKNWHDKLYLTRRTESIIGVILIWLIVIYMNNCNSLMIYYNIHDILPLIYLMVMIV